MNDCICYLIGIGRDLCERLDALGANVYAISRSVEPLNELVSAYPRIKGIQLDLSDWSNTRAELEKHFKDVKIDGLVNNAGIAICKPVSELSEKDFDEYIHEKLDHFKIIFTNVKFGFVIAP